MTEIWPDLKIIDRNIKQQNCIPQIHNHDRINVVVDLRFHHKQAEKIDNCSEKHYSAMNTIGGSNDVTFIVDSNHDRHDTVDYTNAPYDENSAPNRKYVR